MQKQQIRNKEMNECRMTNNYVKIMDFLVCFLNLSQYFHYFKCFSVKTKKENTL